MKASVTGAPAASSTRPWMTPSWLSITRRTRAVAPATTSTFCPWSSSSELPGARKALPQPCSRIAVTRCLPGRTPSSVKLPSSRVRVLFQSQRADPVATTWTPGTGLERWSTTSPATVQGGSSRISTVASPAALTSTLTGSFAPGKRSLSADTL